MVGINGRRSIKFLFFFLDTNELSASEIILFFSSKEIYGIKFFIKAQCEGIINFSLCSISVQQATLIVYLDISFLQQ